MESKDEKLTKERKEALEKIDKVYEAEHGSNKKKLKYGIYCLFAVPSVFLVMLFFIDSSKLVFLVLWIASLFLISAYLIGVEYSDFKLQDNFAGILNEHKERESLLDVPDITDIDLSGLNRPALPGLPRLDMYRREREKREEADANVAMLMQQVAELTEKLNQMQAATGIQLDGKNADTEQQIETKAVTDDEDKELEEELFGDENKTTENKNDTETEE
jgi:hypothetical protein